jgi:tetratricopeptide (TPR) repeat protein
MDQLSAHLDRAWDRVGRGDLAGAWRSAEKSLELAPDDPEVHNLMGYIRAQEGRAEEALEHYERATELDETFVEAMLNAAELKIHPLRDWEGALRLIEEALDWIEDPEEQADAMLLKVDALLGLGDREAARQVLRALPEGPFEGAAIPFAIGRAHFEVGEGELAEPWLRQAIERDPRHGDAHYYLGLVLQERGDARGAALSFLHARDADLRAGARFDATPVQVFERKVQAAIRKLPEHIARVIDDALVIVGDLPGAEVVAEGLDPRIPVLLDDLSPEGAAPRAGRVFVYQRNVERDLGLADIEDEIARALREEIEYVFPEVAQAGGDHGSPGGENGSAAG